MKVISPGLKDKIRYEVKDGRIMVDFDQLLEVLFSMVTESAKLADKTKDPALAIMTLGATSVCEGIETVYKLLREQEGLPGPTE